MRVRRKAGTKLRKLNIKFPKNVNGNLHSSLLSSIQEPSPFGFSVYPKFWHLPKENTP